MKNFYQFSLADFLRFPAPPVLRLTSIQGTFFDFRFPILSCTLLPIIAKQEVSRKVLHCFAQVTHAPTVYQWI